MVREYIKNTAGNSEIPHYYNALLRLGHSASFCWYKYVIELHTEYCNGNRKRVILYSQGMNLYPLRYCFQWGILDIAEIRTQTLKDNFTAGFFFKKKEKRKKYHQNKWFPSITKNLFVVVMANNTCTFLWLECTSTSISTMDGY